MRNFHIETIQIDERESYLKIYFEDVVDQNVISSWLNSQGFFKKANVNEDDNGKIHAIVYPLPDSDIEEVNVKLTAVLQRFEA